MNKVRKFLKGKFNGCARRGWLKFLPDGLFLRIQYYLELGRVLHLKKPRLYNEKLQWLKLYDRKKEYCQLVDKYAVREFVAQNAGEQYLIPMIALYNTVEEIDWDALPDRFVMKCTHGSSANILCTDKSKLDIEGAKKKLQKWMKMNWYNTSREFPYRDIAPRIIVEKFMGDKNGKAPYDYKLMCFDGQPHYIVVDADRFIEHRRNYYDPDWNRQDMFNRHPGYEGVVERPACLEEMLEVARKLSMGIPHVRVDLYVVDGKVYFGEMTFFHGYGMEVYRPRSFEEHMGDLIHLPERKKQA